jgi:hypothetical protein
MVRDCCWSLEQTDKFLKLKLILIITVSFKLINFVLHILPFITPECSIGVEFYTVYILSFYRF